MILPIMLNKKKKTVILNNERAHQDNEDITNINLYKYDSLAQGSRSLVPLDKDEFDRISRDKQLIQSIQQLQTTQGMMMDTQDYHVQLLQENSTKQEEHFEVSKQILDLVKPKKKKKSKGVPQRDYIEIATFEAIMSSEKPPKVHKKSWGRFLMTSAILFYGGLRLNEIAGLTEVDIQQIIKHKKLSIYQKKVNKYRDIFFIEKAIFYIQKTFDEYKDVIFKTDDQLFPAPPSGLPNGDKFIKLINNFLAPFGKERNLVLKSHSYSFFGFILLLQFLKNIKYSKPKN